MNRQLRESIEQDLVRYGRKYRSIDIFAPLELKWLIAYRKASHFKRKSIRGIFWYCIYNRLSRRTMIQIPTRTQIGKGFYIGHCGRIIINPDVIIGDNVNIATGVTIGATNRGERKGVPTVGNQVWIGTNAVIVGKVTVGDDVLIAPNAYVNCDVPAHSIVIGNPAVIHPSEYACRDYINRMV